MTSRRSTEDRRLEIADAALRLVASRGIAALTMVDLAAEVWVTSGALVRHYRSREAILDSAAAHVLRAVCARAPRRPMPPRRREEVAGVRREDARRSRFAR